jgi:hypothetical protein
MIAYNKLFFIRGELVAGADDDHAVVAGAGGGGAGAGAGGAGAGGSGGTNS